MKSLPRPHCMQAHLLNASGKKRNGRCRHDVRVFSRHEINRLMLAIHLPMQCLFCSTIYDDANVV